MAREDDRESFIAMALRSWLDAHERLLTAAEVADAPAMLERAWTKRWREFRVAETRGALAGFYSLGDAGDAEEDNYLWHLYVDPAWQRRGVGTALNRAALNEIAARGAATAWLDVLAKNAKALAFYRALGWCEIGPDLEDPALITMHIATR
jgi:ribosomal-protein-alanine N-acetyltransferase